MLDWTGQTAVVIATGPSLTAEDCLAVRESGAKVIGVNLAFRMAPFADVVYMGDYLCVKTYGHEVPKSASKWSCTPMAKDQHAWNLARGAMGVGLGTRTVVHLLGNSGMQAIGLAYAFGAKKIILIGMDMMKGPRGESHFHGDHPVGMVRAQPFGEWIFKSEALARDLEKVGIDCVNCSRQTALTAFRRGDLQEELKCLSR
jgi:hypothetical protein